MTEKIVILCTCASRDEAARVAGLLVESHLAACVNVISGMESFYRWKGKVERAAEWLLLIKTSRGRFDEVRSAIEKAHSYELPEVIALPIVDGSAGYLSWLEASLENE
jgi:periplasmic divalent cation tolerance protein